LVEYRAAQCPAATTVFSVGTAPEAPSFAWMVPKKGVLGERGSAAASKAPISARQAKYGGPSTTTTAETAMSTIANTAAAAAVASPGAIPVAVIKQTTGLEALATATPTTGARAGRIMAVSPNASTIPAPAKPSSPTTGACTVSA